MSIFVFFFGLMTTLQAATTFKIEPGRYLWHVWKNPPYNEAFPSWTEFKEEVAKLNGLPDAERSFASLPPGTVISLPDLPDPKRDEMVRSQEESIRTLQKDLAEIRKKLETEKAKTFPFWNFWNVILAGCTVLAAAFAGVLYWSKKRLAKECEDKLSDLRDEGRVISDKNKILRHFADLYLTEIRVPSDIGTVLGVSQTAYLPTAQPIEGKPAVYFPKKGDVLLKKVNHFLNEADDEVLTSLGIQRSKKKEDKQEDKQDKEDTEATARM